MRKLLKILVNKRVLILSVLSAVIYLLISRYQISLWYVLLVGVLLGIVFGKVFCRWLCPMGLIMELIMNMNPNSKMNQMYQYHKIGCPIAWISGWLNKYSFFSIKIDSNNCSKCGICDKECYVVQMQPEKFSLYQKNMQKPGNSYTCSKCLKCVVSCPNGSLQYKI
ncbi:MAG: hypothetical protein A2X12_03450 [Bacteroidetes bacterium GWE2_29_8]|nr:MAG: hypothetical protein A2X12_03450 [Bacteroidetes bacterium GWE2_29_8]OFY17392.1 MAG: hypothetical protein A2X02_00660 [Bacteroidetes bacterium GWF2_29_10]